MKRHSLAAAFALTLLGAGCAAEPVEGPDCADGKCDTAAPCAGRVVDLSGRGSSNILAELNDPLADLVLKNGTTCPTTFDGIMEKLRRADKGGFFDNAECVNGSAGIVSRVVSETAQLIGEPTDYRVITTKECRGRERHEIIFSLFGLQAGESRLPDTVEVMAFDEARGVFNSRGARRRAAPPADVPAHRPVRRHRARIGALTTRSAATSAAFPPR